MIVAKIVAAAGFLVMVAVSSHAGEMMPARQSIDRPGNDYKAFTPAQANAVHCQDQCAVESRCEAWVFANGACFLKDPAPNARFLIGVISGVKTTP
jgi:hypothetical protein